MLRSCHNISCNPGYIHVGQLSRILEFREVVKAKSDYEQLKVMTLNFLWLRTGSPSVQQTEMF